MGNEQVLTRKGNVMSIDRQQVVRKIMDGCANLGIIAEPHEAEAALTLAELEDKPRLMLCMVADTAIRIADGINRACMDAVVDGVLRDIECKRSAGWMGMNDPDNYPEPTSTHEKQD